MCTINSNFTNYAKFYFYIIVPREISMISQFHFHDISMLQLLAQTSGDMKKNFKILQRSSTKEPGVQLSNYLPLARPMWHPTARHRQVYEISICHVNDYSVLAKTQNYLGTPCIHP